MTQLLTQPLNLLQQFINHHQIDTVFVAYSGGVDSTALLHLCSQIEQAELIALHVNHGLNPNADDWQAHCENTAKKLNIQCFSHTLTAPAAKDSFEAWARAHRLRFFKSTIIKYKKPLLLTGHHLQDQAETFLLNALRGSGIDGLSAIKSVQYFGNGYLMRPFLSISKTTLTNYCQYQQLLWVEDESNQQTDFKRNAIRHHIIPQLEEISPKANHTLSRSASWCQEASQLLCLYLAQLVKTIEIEQQDALYHKGLDVKAFCQLQKLQQKHLLRYWLKKTFNIQPSHRQLPQILSGLNNNSSNWQYTLDNKTLALQKKVLFIRNNSVKDSNTKIDITQAYQWLQQQQAKQPIPDIEKCMLRERLSQDHCKYLGRKHKQRLKVIFQELNISASRRNEALIICLKNQPETIIAVYPFFICDWPS